jgi:RNA polymerase subunit RPABC4/transcription elongation factor Spt4
MSEIAKTSLRCPKCKSKDFSLDEYWVGHFISFEVIEGTFNRRKGILEPGNPNSLHAGCHKCGHMWKVRGAGSVYDVIT